jgi:glycosyltransferase involved in cell wall biosynthesis
MPQISILMPAYNGSKYIAEAIDSILAQTFSDWELIICDDGSTDNTEPIIRSYIDPRIRFFKNPQNLGPNPTRLFLISKATSPYIAFLDCDDIAMPSKFQRQIDFLNAHNDCAGCGTWGTMIDESGHPIKTMKLAADYPDIRCNLLFSNQFIQSSLLIRKEIFDRETYNPAIPLAEDYDLWCRIFRAGHKMHNIPQSLIQYRWHGTNISETKRENLNDCVTTIFERELSHLALNPSREDLAIHLALQGKNNQSQSDDDFFKKARRWLRQLDRANWSHPIYDPALFRATLCLRWIYACKERGAFRRMLPLPVPLHFKTLKHLIRQIHLKI